MSLGMSEKLRGPASHRVGGRQRRLCSLPALSHHMAHLITVTAWNGDGTWRARALGLGRLGTLHLQHWPPAQHFSPPPSACPYREWSSGWARLRGDIYSSPEMLTCLPHLSQDTVGT